MKQTRAPFEGGPPYGSGEPDPESAVDCTPGPCDLGKICREAVAAARRLRDGSESGDGGHVRVRTYVRNVRPVIAIHDQIREILSALIVNSTEAMPDGGDIYLTVEEHSGWANVYVQDSGNGVSESGGDRTFDPFFTTGEDCRPGLGLADACEIVKGYGGEFEVHRRKDSGATFIIRFPLAPEDRPVKSPPRNSLRNFKVLLVAEEGLVKDLLFHFTTDKGADVSLAATTAAGTKLFRKQDFDIVLLEGGGVVSGRAGFLSFIRKENPETAVALIGATAEPGSSNHPDVAADALIGFPMDMDRLSPLLREAVAARRKRR